MQILRNSEYTSIESITGNGNLENMKKLYNDRIDWKLYNFILDSVTKYIDTGRLIFIGISIIDAHGHVKCDIYHTHYQSGELVTDVEYLTTDEVGWIADNSIIPMKEIEFEYRIHGLTYKIGLLNPDEIQELIDRLNKKFNVTCSIRDKNYLDVKSK